MLLEKKSLVKLILPDVVLAATIIAVTVISYNLGKISQASSQRERLTIQESQETIFPPEETTIKKETEVVVSRASKSGVYHFPWCPGARKISDKNRAVYPTEQAAIDAGYTLAGNCSR